MPPEELLARCLILDLELRGGALADVAGRLGDRVARDLAGIDALAAEASFVAGHNPFDHDLPWLREHRPELRLLRLPALDTLWLPPLASRASSASAASSSALRSATASAASAGTR
jgi:hypothetical protein